jgi:hypothetical protein
VSLICRTIREGQEKTVPEPNLIGADLDGRWRLRHGSPSFRWKAPRIGRAKAMQGRQASGTIFSTISARFEKSCLPKILEPLGLSAPEDIVVNPVLKPAVFIKDEHSPTVEWRGDITIILCG